MRNIAAIKTIAAAVMITIRFGLLAFIFFSLPCMAFLLGTTNPGLDSANTSTVSPTFLKSNEPSELIWNSALFLIWSRMVFEKSTDEPTPSVSIREAIFTPSPYTSSFSKTTSPRCIPIFNWKSLVALQAC